MVAWCWLMVEWGYFMGRSGQPLWREWKSGFERDRMGMVWLKTNQNPGATNVLPSAHPKMAEEFAGCSSSPHVQLCVFCVIFFRFRSTSFNHRTWLPRSRRACSSLGTPEEGDVGCAPAVPLVKSWSKSSNSPRHEVLVCKHTHWK